MKERENIVTIKEYSAETLDKLNDNDVAYLKKDCFKCNGHTPFEIQELKDDKVKIKNTSYSGIIQLENTRIHFSTKVKANLFFMLSFLRDEKSFCYDPEVSIDIKEGANFFDILGRMFLNELQEIFKKGFYKKYVRKEENVSFLKGKLCVRKQIKNEIRKNTKFQCSYEDLTYNNLENQIILRATALLVPLIRFNDEIKKDLIKYSYLLREEVDLVNVLPEDCNKVQFSKLNDYYAAIISFSKVIMQNYFIRSTHHGESKGFNFVVNMNKVYEDFITTLIEEVVSEEREFSNFVVEKQKQFDSLVLEKDLITRPDVILRRKDSLDDYPLIIDAKYKAMDHNSDYFQVIAYSLAIPTAKNCCLIYPSVESVNTTMTLVRNPSNPNSSTVNLHTVRIDIDRATDFNEYIKGIKKDLKLKLIPCLRYKIK